MQNGKFFSLLYTLNEKEVQVFHKHLKQLYGKEPISLRAFEYAKDLYLSGPQRRKPDMVHAHRRAYQSALSDQEKERKKMLKNTLNLFHDLHLRLRDFLLFEKVRDDSLESQALWLEVLQERKLQDEYSKQAARFYTETKAAPKIDAKKYLLEMTASYFQYQQLALVRPTPDTGALQQCLETLEICAETIRIKLACQLANLRKMQPPKVSTTLPAPPLELPEARIIKSSPLLALYCDIYQLIEKEEEEYFNRIQAVFVEETKRLDPDELHGALGYLHNYAAIQIRNGAENNIGKRIHELNQHGRHYGLFDRPEGMSDTQFTNIINLACSVKDYDWATSFMEEHQRALPEKIRADIVVLAGASIAFTEAHFERVLMLLGPIKFKHLHHTIRARSLMLRSYLELNNDDALEDCLTFESMLERNRDPRTDAVEAMLASVRIIKMFILKKEDQETILERIEKAPTLYFKPWLKKQAAEYKATYAPHKRSG